MVPLGAPARAAQGPEAGSWWRSQPDGAPLPAPPQVPDGGLWVANDAAGPSAVSAVRIQLESGDTAPLLHVRVHSNQSTGSAPIVACPATGPWQPATAGAWNSRPPSDCAKGKVDGVLSGDGTTMSFDLSSLAAFGAVDVVLQPPPQQPVAAAPPSPVPGAPSPPSPPPPGSTPAYDVTFEKPSPADVAVTPGPAASDSLAPATPSPTADYAPNPSAFSPSSAFTPAADVLGPTSAQPVLSAAPPPTPASLPAASPAALGVLRAAAHSGRADRVTAAAAFVLLALWAWRVMTAEGARSVGGSGRPRLTLYDVPELVLASGPPSRYASGPRVGAPPALR